MAVKNNILGKQVYFLVGTIPVSCAEEVSLDITAAELASSCVGSGDIETFELGKKTIKGSAKGMFQIITGTDVATNYSGADWLDALLNNTELTVIFKGGETGEFKYELKAYVTSWKVSANHNDLSKYDVSFRANSITRTTLS